MTLQPLLVSLAINTPESVIHCFDVAIFQVIFIIRDLIGK